MQFLRAHLTAEGVLPCAALATVKDGTKVRAAGVVLIRQRPGKGNAVFITLEDESGIANVLLWARDFEQQRRAVMAARLMVIEGEVQRSKEGVTHLMAKRVTDATALLARLSEASPALSPEPMRGDEAKSPVYPPATAASRRHPRNVRVVPRSRDFR